MRSASIWLLAPVLALSSLIAACGDDGGDGDGGDDTPKAGASGSEEPGAGSGGRTSSGGSGGASTSAGAGGKVSGSGGKTSGTGTVTGSTKLSEIDTAAEAEAACERAADSFDESDVQAAREGMCTFSGILAQIQGGDCEQAKAACLADVADPSECSADDIPDCADVTLDEYIACSTAQAKASAAFFEDLTCESDLSSLPTEPPEPPAVCVSVFAACPELAPDTE